MKIIELVKEIGYLFELRDRIGAINIYNPEGVKRVHTFSKDLHRKIFFGIDRIEVSEKELFEYLYKDITDEEMCHFQHGCSQRSYNYIQSVKRNIGLVGIGIDSDLMGKCDVDGEETEYYYSKVESDIDDWCETKYYFNHHPSERDIRTAIKIHELEVNFRIGEYKDEFKCWECGHKTHWLDVPGNFFDKLDGLEEKYCGC